MSDLEPPTDLYMHARAEVDELLKIWDRLLGATYDTKAALVSAGTKDGLGTCQAIVTHIWRAKIQIIDREIARCQAALE